MNTDIKPAVNHIVNNIDINAVIYEAVKDYFGGDPGLNYADESKMYQLIRKQLIEKMKS